MSTILIKNRPHELPSWWSGAGFTAKAAWVSSLGVSYPEACAIIRGKRRPKPKSPPPEQVYAEMERRGLG